MSAFLKTPGWLERVSWPRSRSASGHPQTEGHFGDIEISPDLTRLTLARATGDTLRTEQDGTIGWERTQVYPEDRRVAAACEFAGRSLRPLAKILVAVTPAGQTWGS